MNKLKHLNYWDIGILTLIFFGMAIWSSTVQYLGLIQQQQIAPEKLVFNDYANWWAVIQEIGLLILAYLYLRFRRFDFKQFDFKINAYTPLKIAAYILIAGTVATLFEYGQYLLFPHLYPEMADIAEYSTESYSQYWSLSLLVLALVNGFFEEFFFMGLMFAVSKKHLPYVLLFSLAVRFAFHTYQGIAAAATITTLGIVFILLRFKNKDLIPFALAHSFFDIFGLGLFFLASLFY